MQPSKYPLILALVLAALFIPGRPAGSQVPTVPATTIRIASLAPPGSSFVKVLKGWSRTLQKETEGRVELRVFSGGSEGSDRDLVQRMKAGKLDAAGIATTGLSMVAPELQVLTAPGLLTDDAQLDRVRDKLDAQLQKLIDSGGFKLLAWGDGGKNRVFSATQFGAPADLAGKPAWAGKNNPVALEYAKALGANPVRVGSSGVFPGLKEGKLEVVPASAMAAVAFQWYTKLKYMSSGNFNIIVGGSIISKKKFNELSKADRRDRPQGSLGRRGQKGPRPTGPTRRLQQEPSKNSRSRSQIGDRLRARVCGVHSCDRSRDEWAQGGARDHRRRGACIRSGVDRAVLERGRRRRAGSG
jgi:TRAP-type C4-dicarboxylate transport system substrate-binding protein